MTVLDDDFAQIVTDSQASSGYLAWARDNHGGKGYSIDNPKTGSELQKWMVFRDQLLRGTRPVPPTMTTAMGKWLVDGGVLYLDATVPAPAPPPPPPPPPPVPAPSGKLWGIAPANGPYNPAPSVQFPEFAKLGVNCPRFGGDDTASLLARQNGFKQWLAFISGDGSATPAQVVAYAQKYPEAMVGFGNELNLNGAWTVAAVAAKQIAVYKAVKAAGLPNKVGLSCIASPKSTAEGLTTVDWCKHLRAAGCVYGEAFDFADFHDYDADPTHIDAAWSHYWTPDANGDSCVSVLGNPPFVLSEFGAQIGKDVPANTVEGPTQGDDAQAAAVTAWVTKLKSLPNCLGGMWFQAYDGTAWNGFGLIDGSGNHRPSYDAFKAAIAA
jgi:hypothetical protein